MARAPRRDGVPGSYGPLALTGTHWLEDYPDGRLPDIPGLWTDQEDGVLLTAAPEDGLSLDGKPFTGEVRLDAEPGSAADARVGLDERRFVVAWCAKGSGAYATSTPPPRRARPSRASRRRRTTSLVGAGALHAVRREPDRTCGERGRSRPRSGARRHPRLHPGRRGPHAPGVGGERRLAVGRVRRHHHGDSSYRFRFLRPAAPDAEGRTTVDFDRAVLPPCAFADHFICPFPPPGNTLGRGRSGGGAHAALTIHFATPSTPSAHSSKLSRRLECPDDRHAIRTPESGKINCRWWNVS